MTVASRHAEPEVFWAHLPALVAAFLSSRGGAASEPEPGVWIADGATDPATGAPIRLAALAPPPGAPLNASWALDALTRLTAAGAAAPIPIVAISRQGVSGADQARIAEAGGQMLSPLQFFDWFFRARQGQAEDPRAIGVDKRLRDLIDPSLLRVRAPQPFRRVTDPTAGPDPGPAAGDLLDELRAAMAPFPDRPKLWVVSGPAGVGKTVLVNALLKDRHDAFNAAKRLPAAAASRPLLFEPKALGATDPQTIEALIAKVYGGEIGGHAPPAAFDWLHDHGFATWIFDGLDEFFRGQNDFFHVLRRKLNAADGRARILICTRDSLFASSDALITFLREQRAADPESVEIFELARWSADAKRAFLAVKLREDGVMDEALPRRMEELSSELEARPAMAELTDLPFYCALFVNAIQADGAAALSDETGLLQHAVDALIDREAGKIFADWDWSVFVSGDDAVEVRALADRAAAHGLDPTGGNPFADALAAYGRDNLEFMLGAAAHFHRVAAAETRSLEHVSAAEWREVLSPAFIDARLDPETEARVELALLQFAFFGRAGGDGLAFVHDLIADFLAAKYAFAVLSEHALRHEAWRQALGRRTDLVGSSYLRFLGAFLRADESLAEAARRFSEDPRLSDTARDALAALLEAGAA